MNTALAEDLFLSGTIASGTYNSTGDIIVQENSTIETGSDVTLSAYTDTVINPGFSVEAGSTLTIVTVDNDGLDNEFEHTYFGTLAYGPNDDTDGDGLTNLEEYSQGINPAVPDSVAHGIHATYLDGGEYVGNSVNILNGNVFEPRKDLEFPSPHKAGLSFQAFYNSRKTTAGAFGYGWTHTYSASMVLNYQIKGDTYLKITDATGHARFFQEETAGVYNGALDEKSRVRLEGGEYVWYRLDGSSQGFSVTGELLWVDDHAGNRIAIQYSGGLISTVSDSATGRMLTFNHNTESKIESITGPVTDAVTDGVWVEYGYDANGNQTSVTYADGSGFSYEYTDTNDAHNLTAKQNAMNHLLATWSYDNYDRAVNTFTNDGKGVSVDYESDTQVDVVDAYNTARSYTISLIDYRRRVTAVSGISNAPYADSNAVSWDYDNDMNLVEIEFAGGTVNQYQNFDAKGNPQAITLGAGTADERVITLTYHPDMNLPLSRTEASVLAAGDKVTTWDYDDDYDTVPNENPTALVSRIVDNGYTRNISGYVNAYDYVTTITYNNNGQVLSVDGPLAGTGDTTSFVYDGSTGDLLSTTQPLVGTAGYSNYDAAGFVGQIMDVNGQSRTFTYDGRGRLTDIENLADGSEIGFNFNLAGQLMSKTDEDGISIAYDYDSIYGRLDKTTDSNSSYILYDYDPQGNLTEKAYYDALDNLSRLQSWDYQHPTYPGMLYKQIQADNTYTEYAYDSDGNVSGITDPNGNTTTYTYNPFNQPSTVTQPGSVATGYAFDGHGSLAIVTDANTNATTYTHDDMGRVVSIVSPDTGTTSFEYDNAGNRRWKSDAKGITVEYVYDLLNRLTEVNFPDSSQDIDYSYDSGANGMGRLTGMIDPTGSTAYTYDSRGRLMQKTSTIGTHVFTVSQTLSLAGRVNKVTYPTGRETNYDRIACMCRVDNITTTDNNVTTTLVQSLAYQPFGQSSGMASGGGGGVANTINLDGRMTFANQGSAREQSFTYDHNGNLTGLTSTNTPWYNRTYTYDALNRLETADGPFGGTITFTYDDVGNRLTRTLKDTDTYTYVTASNRIDEITGSMNRLFDTDANGNITDMGDRTLVYNQNNRIIRVEEGSDTLGEYAYNGIGQRVSKTIGSNTNYFIYDFKDNLIAEANGSGSIVKEYLYRDRIRLAMVDVSSGSIYSFQNDHIGTPVLMTDSGGNVVWEAIYYPFGEASVNPNSEVVNNFRFAGQYFDAESGLHYNYHRYYDPATGRYLTPDPIGLDGGINLYAYAGNNPILYTDPEGLLFGINAGESYGDSAAMYYAEITTDPCATRLEKTGAWVGGVFASLWTPATSNETFLTLLPTGALGKWLGRPFWRYVGPNSNPMSPWMTRGISWKAPYRKNFTKAKDALQMPFKPTNIEKVKVPWYKPVRGPRSAIKHPEWGKGGGAEYVRGWRWPE